MKDIYVAPFHGVVYMLIVLFVMWFICANKAAKEREEKIAKPIIRQRQRMHP